MPEYKPDWNNHLILMVQENHKRHIRERMKQTRKAKRNLFLRSFFDAAGYVIAVGALAYLEWQFLTLIF